MENDEVNKLCDNIIGKVTQEEVTEEKEERDGRKISIPYSEGFKTIEAALQYTQTRRQVKIDS